MSACPVKKNNLYCVKFQLCLCFHNDLSLVILHFMDLFEAERFLFLFYSKSLFDANSLCSNALISQALSNITLQHCWSIIPETLWIDVLNFVLLSV